MSPTLPSNDDQSLSSQTNTNIKPQPVPEAIEQEILKEHKPQPVGFFRKIFNYFKEIAIAIKEKIFGKKQEEIKPIISPQDPNPKTELVKEKQKQLYQESKKPDIQLTPLSNKNPWEEIGITKEEYIKLQAESLRVEQQLANDKKQEGIIPANVISKESLALTSSINDIVKFDYLYNDDNIKQILESSLDLNKVHIQQLSLAWSDEINKPVLSEIVKTLKEGGKESAIIPIETGGEHWTVMVATYNKEIDKITFTYIDPTGNPIDYRAGLLNLIKEVQPTAIIKDLKTPQQENVYDCGVFICDDAIKIVKGQEVLSTDKAKNMGIELRKAHAEMLTKELAKQQAPALKNNIKGQQPNSFVSRIMTTNNNEERTR